MQLAIRPFSFGRVAAGSAAALMAIAIASALLAPQDALAQGRGKGGGAASSPLGGLGGDSKEPIKIDADKLDVLDKDNRAVFSGNVVAVQGETTVRCSIMTVFYEGRSGQGSAGGAKPAAATPTAAPAATPVAPGAPAASGDSSIKRIECKGPVTVVSKTQAASSDNAVFDRANNQVIMTGNVALNDGPNITRGEKLTYNTVTGIANVQSPPGVRVQGLFVPNSTETGKTDAKTGTKPAAGAAPAKPATPTN